MDQIVGWAPKYLDAILFNFVLGRDLQRLVVNLFGSSFCTTITNSAATDFLRLICCSRLSSMSEHCPASLWLEVDEFAHLTSLRHSFDYWLLAPRNHPCHYR